MESEYNNKKQKKIERNITIITYLLYEIHKILYES